MNFIIFLLIISPRDAFFFFFLLNILADRRRAGMQRYPLIIPECNLHRVTFSKRLNILSVSGV